MCIIAYNETIIITMNNNSKMIKLKITYVCVNQLQVKHVVRNRIIRLVCWCPKCN